MKRIRWFTAVAALVGVLSMSGGRVLAAPDTRAPRPTSGMPPVITEEVERHQYEAFRQRIDSQENRRAPAAKPGEITPMFMDGDTRMNGPYYAYGSGAISDDSTSGIANNIWPIFLRVLSWTRWKTAGTILSNAALILNIMVDRTKESTAATYHTYNYNEEDGDYYKGGNWYTAARTEKRDTWVWGWALYRDSNGTPHDASESWTYYTSEQGCHWDNYSWLLGMASDGYNYNTPFIGESYNTCVIWNP